VCVCVCACACVCVCGGGGVRVCACARARVCLWDSQSWAASVNKKAAMHGKLGPFQFSTCNANACSTAAMDSEGKVVCWQPLPASATTAFAFAF
jgi:hypothetical protein